MEYASIRYSLSYAAYIGILITLPHCTYQSQFSRKKVTIHRPTPSTIPQPSLSNEPPPITVWIHGTRFIRRPVFYQYFNGKPGLKKATDIDCGYHVRMVANSLYRACPDRFPLDTFYIFGWSGKLSATEREFSARVLYEELSIVRKRYIETYGCAPRIHVVTHSHGGNVALNLVKVKDPFDCDFIIDRLILLACPVQARTMDMAHSSIFKKVYAIYSSLDLVQVIAPQIVYRIVDDECGKRHVSFKIPPLSERLFPPADNVVQVKIKLNSRSIMHAEFVESPFLTLLPNIISEIDVWHEEDRSLKPRLLCVQAKPRYEKAIRSYIA